MLAAVSNTEQFNIEYITDDGDSNDDSKFTINIPVSDYL